MEVKHRRSPKSERNRHVFSDPCHAPGWTEEIAETIGDPLEDGRNGFQRTDDASYPGAGIEWACCQCVRSRCCRRICPPRFACVRLRPELAQSASPRPHVPPPVRACVQPGPLRGSHLVPIIASNITTTKGTTRGIALERKVFAVRAFAVARIRALVIRLARRTDGLFDAFRCQIEAPDGVPPLRSGGSRATYNQDYVSRSSSSVGLMF